MTKRAMFLLLFMTRNPAWPVAALTGFPGGCKKTGGLVHPQRQLRDTFVEKQRELTGSASSK
jgi:hypothetical protein